MLVTGYHSLAGKGLLVGWGGSNPITHMTTPTCSDAILAMLREAQTPVATKDLVDTVVAQTGSHPVRVKTVLGQLKAKNPPQVEQPSRGFYALPVTPVTPAGEVTPVTAEVTPVTPAGEVTPVTAPYLRYVRTPGVKQTPAGYVIEGKLLPEGCFVHPETIGAVEIPEAPQPLPTEAVASFRLHDPSLLRKIPNDSVRCDHEPVELLIEGHQGESWSRVAIRGDRTLVVSGEGIAASCYSKCVKVSV